VSVRPPRVHITYEVETSEGIETRELPFVVGVLADLSGQPEVPLPPLGWRKFVEIDRENFDQVLAAMAPRVAPEPGVELRFRCLADFAPEGVVRQNGSLSGRLDAILHAPEFQRLEATWRDLHYLVAQTETSERLRISVLNASKAELQRDFEEGPEWEQSALFRKVYEEVYGLAGAAPFGVLIGDYEFGHLTEDVELLARISQVAAAAHTPFIAAAGPQMFGWKTFAELAEAGVLGRIFEREACIGWRSFRSSDTARYVCLVLPRMLLRLPYGEQTVPVAGLRYEEDVSGSEHSKLLWGNAACALAVRLAEAFRIHGWCAAIQGVEGDGLVTDLPGFMKCPTEAPIPERREAELNRLGFISLCHWAGTDLACFFSAASCQRPPEYQNDAVTAAAILFARLPYILAVSRFAQYLKVMMRDKIGSFRAREDCERFLNAWINQYVMLDEDASQEAKALYPLAEARVEVAEDPEKPGRYLAVAFLRPHFQLEDLGLAVRVVVELPASAG